MTQLPKSGFFGDYDSEPVFSGYWNGINCRCCCVCACLYIHAYVCMCEEERDTDKEGERQKGRESNNVCVCGFPASFVKMWLSPESSV